MSGNRAVHYAITTRSDRRVDHHGVTGEAVGRYLAIRRVGGEWTIDHRPTGYQIAVAATYEDARRAAERLVLAWDGWGSASPTTVADAPATVREIVRQIRRQMIEHAVEVRG